jgi:hypothetical protein
MAMAAVWGGEGGYRRRDRVSSKLLATAAAVELLRDIIAPWQGGGCRADWESDGGRAIVNRQPVACYRRS